VAGNAWYKRSRGIHDAAAFAFSSLLAVIDDCLLALFFTTHDAKENEYIHALSCV
jgi:hypothetical protein